MKTVANYLDEFKRKIHLCNDSELARAWDVSRQMVNKYRNGSAPLPAERLQRVAEVLGIDSNDIRLAYMVEFKTRKRDRLSRQISEMVKNGIITSAVGLAILAGTPVPSQAQGNANDCTLYAPDDRRKKRRRRDDPPVQTSLELAQAA